MLLIDNIYSSDIFSVKRVLKDMRKEPANWSPQGGLMEGSGKVVLTAVTMYFFFKYKFKLQILMLLNLFTEMDATFCLK